MQWIGKIAKWVWENLSRIALMLAWGASFGVPAWMVSTIHALQPYQPVAGVVIGITCFALAGLTYMAIGVGAYWWTTAKIRSDFHKERDRINPMETVFRNQRIALADLITPYDNRIMEKQFIDCEIMGPANIYIWAGSGAVSFQGNTFVPAETVMMRNGAPLPNCVVLHNCGLTRCKFFGVTLFFHEGSYEAANRVIDNLNWITVTPDHPLGQNPPLPDAPPPQHSAEVLPPKS